MFTHGRALAGLCSSSANLCLRFVHKCLERSRSHWVSISINDEAGMTILHEKTRPQHVCGWYLADVDEQRKAAWVLRSIKSWPKNEKSSAAGVNKPVEGNKHFEQYQKLVPNEIPDWFGGSWNSRVDQMLSAVWSETIMTSNITGQKP